MDDLNWTPILCVLIFILGLGGLMQCHQSHDAEMKCMEKNWFYYGDHCHEKEYIQPPQEKK
jgi:hypothetical protein